MPTSGRPVLHPANGHRDNLHASKKKRKAKAGSNRFGNRRLSRSEQSGRLGLLLLRAANASPSLRFNRIRAMPDVIRQQVSRSEEHTSELQSLMRISYAVFCLKKKTLRTTVNY